MPDITVHLTRFVPLDDTPYESLAAALVHCIRGRLPVDDQFERAFYDMNACLDDFGHPDALARDLTDLLYAPVGFATAHLDLAPPPRMREALYYALARSFSQDADLLPFQAWTLAHALHEAVQAGSAAIATACLADLRALALPPPRDGEDPRYRHEPDQSFMHFSGEEEDDDDDALLPHPIEIISADDPATPLERVLQPTAAARARLARLVARQQAQDGPGATDGAATALLAACIATARALIAHTDAFNEEVRKTRARRLN